MVDEVSRAEVVAFRLAAHHLADRLARDRLGEAVAACAVQNSPPGSALLAMHARVHGLTTERLDHAVADEKRLLQTWSMRGAPFFVPTVDASVFTTGVLPPTEAALRHFIPGVEYAVDRLGIGVTEAVELAGAEIRGVLSGRRLAIDELGSALAERIGRKLPESRRAAWEEEGPYAAGQPLGEAIVHFCVRILTLQRIVCFAPRDGNKAPFVLVDEWLGGPLPEVDPAVARAELLRRYLHCYGPSTRGDFAAWLGLAAGDTGPWWSLLEHELMPVAFGGAAWMLAEDRERLRSTPGVKGVRLLPPRDPYTQARDRGTLVNRAYHRTIWKTVGEPGTVLVDGEIVGTWRPRKRGRTLTIAVTAFGSLAARDRKRVGDEAESLEPLRGASSVEVVFDTR